MIYQMAFTVRCGSTLLCEYLTANGLGEPTEYFQYDALGVMSSRHHEALGVPRGDLPEFLRVLLAARAVDGVFGAKVSWHQKNALLDDARRSNPAVADLGDVFPGMKWLYIRRRDTIGQAVSAWRAIKSGRWHSPERATGTERPEYDYYRILSLYQSILTEEELWRAYFRRQPEPPLVIDYEDLLAEPRAVVRMVAVHLLGPACRLADAAAVRLTSRTDRMRDDWSADVQARFTEDLERIGAAGHWAARHEQVLRWQDFFERERWKG